MPSKAPLRMARRQNPDIFIIATGCYAQRAAAEITAIAGVDCVVG